VNAAEDKKPDIQALMMALSGAYRGYSNMVRQQPCACLECCSLARPNKQPLGLACMRRVCWWQGGCRTCSGTARSRTLMPTRSLSTTSRSRWEERGGHLSQAVG
jgi:hypothetical protein